ncbi:hypothetical protein Tco_0567184 [Tanacetum coccineum]
MATQQNIIINDDSENGLTKAMMLLDRSIRQRSPTCTNNRLSISSNVVQSGVIDVQGKKNENVGTNVGNAGNHPHNVGYTENAEIKLPMLRKIQQDMKESFNKNFQEIKKVVVILHPGGLFANENEHTFMVLFREDYDSFTYKFFHKLARIENQMCSVKFHECDSKTYLTELRKQCEAFLTNGNPKSLESSMINYYLKVFQEYTRHDIKSIKNMLIRYLNDIEKEIDAGAHNKEELWTKERCQRKTRKSKNNADARGNEKQDESSRLGNDTRAEGADIRLSNDTKPSNEVEQNAEQCLDKRPLLASVIENKTTESLNQTLESENDCLEKIIAQLQKDFSKLEAQSIAFEIALQHKT